MVDDETKDFSGFTVAGSSPILSNRHDGLLMGLIYK